eukprot:CAMPEP_0175046390 /NCGR_PEP_ID=MMETSP0052_2-20121109/5007_1 /TAXON_ID=51329 ORGANISM="Polytomella parva, Strain SAG 63-3" /NCGR_SAMPLE_ID=MMETSP0052_2 /ASSEMBLY_ACC=CAM_ASM_000194 /LENGTH=74 /DNA_ID=CAMNT_0016310137 /DNA_START=2599 /DNA_END=2823 /DNA_ORIENTATION=+
MTWPRHAKDDTLSLKPLMTWIGSTERERQSQILTQLSYPADTMTSSVGPRKDTALTTASCPRNFRRKDPEVTSQ